MQGIDRVRTRALSTLALAYALAAPAAASEDAWTAIAGLRERLESASPLTAGFTQTFIAAGFSTGDAETGRIWVDLPACLRWDYEGDFPNSFLLCGHLAHGWNHGETSGRRQFLSRGDEPGLDLLRLEVTELRERYSARLLEPDGELVAVELTAAEEAASEVRAATLRFAAGENGLRSLSYRDVEGNRTRFEFGAYGPVRERGVFTPPADLEWLQD